MVMKISAWRKKLSTSSIAMPPYTPEMFLKCQWQISAGISTLYLVYRLAFAAFFLGVLVASIVDPGEEETDLNAQKKTAVWYAKWPIYLTHWGYTVCTLQALLGAYIVSEQRCLHAGKDLGAIKMKPTMHVYWVLHICATIGALAITTIYWLFVFNPVENKVTALNLLVHAGNSVLMLLDVCLVSFPVRLIDFFWPLGFSVGYILFNFIYYIAGGTDRKNRTYIYKILDWTKPGSTITVVIACLVFVMVLHVLLCAISFARSRLGEKWRRRQIEITQSRTSQIQGVANEIPINDLA